MPTPFNRTAHNHLVLMGYEYMHHQSDEEDTGSPESGPKVSGTKAHDEYIFASDGHVVLIDCDGRSHQDRYPPEFFDEADYLFPIPDLCDHMSLEDWIDVVKIGAFIDDDGFGHLATATKRSDIKVSPSMLQLGETAEQFLEARKVRPIYTHVVWYNR